MTAHTPECVRARKAFDRARREDRDSDTGWDAYRASAACPVCQERA